MEIVYVVGTLDVAELTFAAFVVFFIGLVFYLRREDRREGYPLEYVGPGRAPTPGLVWMPEPKILRLSDGKTVEAPNGKPDDRPVNGTSKEPFAGSPLEPTGDPMRDGVGPAAYAERAHEPDMTFEGHTKIVPMRVATEFAVSSRDPDPRGMTVMGTDGAPAGTVVDIWIDRAEVLIRYLEVELQSATAAAPIVEDVAAAPAPTMAKRVLLPMTFAKVDRRRNQIKVSAILSSQFADVPALSNPDQVTLLEEDKISAYYGGGTLYAYPQRQEPLI